MINVAQRSLFHSYCGDKEFFSANEPLISIKDTFLIAQHPNDHLLEYNDLRYKESAGFIKKPWIFILVEAAV